MKLIYPDENITKEQAEELLSMAIECRKRVKDQMLRRDTTFDVPEFSFIDKGARETKLVKTAEETGNSSQF